MAWGAEDQGVGGRDELDEGVGRRVQAQQVRSRLHLRVEVDSLAGRPAHLRGDVERHLDDAEAMVDGVQEVEADVPEAVGDGDWSGPGGLGRGSPQQGLNRRQGGENAARVVNGDT